MNRTPTQTEPTDEEWDQAGKAVLEIERQERRNPKWVPTYLNLGYEFTEQVRALIAKTRK